MKRPRFIAEQARHATGLLGRLIAFIMSYETKGDNRRAIDALAVAPMDDVLDVGCGHGRSLTELASLAPRGKVVGVDPSAVMIGMAVRRAGDMVASGRVQVVTASVEALPFPDGSFDKALCVHVVYFWRDLDRAFAEVARVLKPGGRFVVMFQTNASQAVGAFPADVYRFPSLDEIMAALASAGLRVEAVDAASELTSSVLVRQNIAASFRQTDIGSLSWIGAFPSASWQSTSGFRNTLLPFVTPSPNGTKVPYSSSKSKRMAFLP
jgi:ubiquinone/menaquinone biosynthesis C-methylase UbiE